MLHSKVVLGVRGFHGARNIPLDDGKVVAGGGEATELNRFGTAPLGGDHVAFLVRGDMNPRDRMTDVHVSDRRRPAHTSGGSEQRQHEGEGCKVFHSISRTSRNPTLLLR